MGSNYHSSYTTASIFHVDDLNPPLSTLDAAITMNRGNMMRSAGAITWDSTAGTLAWSLPMQFLMLDPDDGKMITNEMASGSITIPSSNIAYVDLSTVDDATVSATYAAFSTASTALQPPNRIILGAVNTALEFYPRNLAPHLNNILNHVHQIDSASAHSGTATEGNIFIASSAGLPIDGAVLLSSITSTIAVLATAIGINESSIAANATAIGINVSSIAANATAIGINVSSIAANSGAIAAITTHAQSHQIDSTADHTSTASASHIFIADADGLPIESGRQLSEYLGARESSLTCAATFTVDFSTAETRFVSLTTNASAIITGGVNGHTYKLRVQQDATGNWTLALGATAGTIRWEGGVAPTITTSATVSDVLTFLRSNGTWFAKAAQNF